MLWHLSVWAKAIIRARLLPDLQVATTWIASLSWVYHTLLKKVTGGDVACQVGKAYNICPPSVLVFFKDLDAIMRS